MVPVPELRMKYSVGSVQGAAWLFVEPAPNTRWAASALIECWDEP